jgi:hypothetical protein
MENASPKALENGDGDHLSSAFADAMGEKERHSLTVVLAKSAY